MVGQVTRARYVELTPPLLKLLLLLFLLDLVVRRWENLSGMLDWLRERRSRTA